MSMREWIGVLALVGMVISAVESLPAYGDPLAPSLTLQQEEKQVEGGSILISTLTVDLETAPLQMRPIWGRLTNLTGLAPLPQLALEHQAVAAINGGFFNRLTRQPIGAIRLQGEWISSSVLERGAVAWNDTGDFRFSRLHLQGSVQTSLGDEIPLVGLNSAYVVAGLSQYTPDWGSVYTTQTDAETVLVVEKDQLQAIYPAGAAGSLTLAIPADGYLLAARQLDGMLAAQRLLIGDLLTVSWQANPPFMQEYPHVLAAGPLLMLEGEIVLDAALEGFQPGFRTQKAARSALCQLRDGQLLWLTAGRSQEVAGVTLQWLAGLLQAMGCRHALNLDGGTSSTLYLNGRIVNLPAPGSVIPRVHNGLGLIPLP
ncbi:MAG: phosphodiester glycosidase family protein [Synechococcaceae cyanobacterium SM2_3_1]|nr:phosphodiester glycosidase family protein [Synechococcaceae cyanobacterium SM2_3_1]